DGQPQPNLFFALSLPSLRLCVLWKVSLPQAPLQLGFVEVRRLQFRRLDRLDVPPFLGLGRVQALHADEEHARWSEIAAGHPGVLLAADVPERLPRRSVAAASAGAAAGKVPRARPRIEICK